MTKEERKEAISQILKQRREEETHYCTAMECAPFSSQVIIEAISYLPIAALFVRCSDEVPPVLLCGITFCPFCGENLVREKKN
jgi:hypothetical protein